MQIKSLQTKSYCSFKVNDTTVGRNNLIRAVVGQ